MHVDDLWVTFLPICGDSVVMWYPVRTGIPLLGHLRPAALNTQQLNLKAHTQIMKII